jgi:quinol monooxygenase YgiN
VPTEIVRLPVAPDDRSRLAEYLQAHPYFRQEGLTAYRILEGEEAEEVALVLDWSDHSSAERALQSPEGRALLAGLQSFLIGAPGITFFKARA